jgi:hypothetical protein
MKHLPNLGVWQRLYYQRVKLIQDVKILDLVPYKKLDAKRFLIDEFGWRDYGGKHYESVFIICNAEITRVQALEELAKPPDDLGRQRDDKRYVAKKLGWTEAEFEDILALPPRPHEDFGTDAFQCRRADFVMKFCQPFARLGRALVNH